MPTDKFFKGLNRQQYISEDLPIKAKFASTEVEKKIATNEVVFLLDRSCKNYNLTFSQKRERERDRETYITERGERDLQEKQKQFFTKCLSLCKN